MPNYKTIKGTHDLLPGQMDKWREVESQCLAITKQFGYQEIRTPVFESTELFQRGIGSDTDIVTKEMYSWKDQGGNRLTLKPELTAPVARAYIQHQMGNQNPLQRLSYYDTLFRRERPQKGRQRQFYQFGAEAIGSPHPEQDAEIISLAYTIYKSFNIQNMIVKLNSIGSAEIRPAYLSHLRNTLQSKKQKLCNTCKTRLEINALRIFDCKNQSCQEILDTHAPLIFHSISEDDKRHFDTVMDILTSTGIPFEHDKKLVRGLDYYSHTTFEVTSQSLGSQDALCGGGRYDGLIQQLGGKYVPAVGFAAGVERLLLAMAKNNAAVKFPLVYMLLLGEQVIKKGSELVQKLRKTTGKTIVMETLRRSMKAQMREAGRCNAEYSIILGENELNSRMVVVKHMESGEQYEVPFSDLSAWFSVK